MKIQHHPDDSTLMSYAAGSLPSVLSAVVASHVSMCAHCRRELKLMESMGLALLDDIETDRVTTRVPVLALRKLESVVGPARSARAKAGHDIDVPSPMRHLVGDRLTHVGWRKLGFGVWHYPLPVPKACKGVLTLLKIEPGRSMPEHGHGGIELTLILSGAYEDHTGRYLPGDIADLDQDVEHNPVADAVAGCICLVASEQKASFKGLVSRMIQPWTGF
jgi:putative transcriptional regulator